MRPIPIVYALLAMLSLVFGILLAQAVHQRAYADGYSSAADAGPSAAATDPGPTDPAPTAVPASTATAPATTAPAVTMPDPVADPVAEVTLITKLWRGGFFASAAIMIAFALLSWARAKLGWLKQGRQAVYAAIALGTLGVLAAGVADGSTPNIPMLLSALMTGWALYVKSEHVPKPA